tara:strand:+ start:314 stop:991 length:678 start_codon:yes stop_codon:yes gene_type:complete
MKPKYKYFLKRFFYYLYGEKFYKRLDYDWTNKPSRSDIIQKIINYKNYKTYLEIGCDKNVNFTKIKINKKLGVDPLSGGTHRMTSNSFFQENKENFDIVFLDGLHTYEQTITDIKNSLSVLNENGIIIVHDCLPKKIWNQVVPRLYGHWNGDVWKAIVETRTIKEVDCYTCIADHGLGIILKRKNKNLITEKINNFKDLKFSQYYNKHSLYMNPINHQDLEEIIK